MVSLVLYVFFCKSDLVDFVRCDGFLGLSLVCLVRFGGFDLVRLVGYVWFGKFGWDNLVWQVYLGRFGWEDLIWQSLFSRFVSWGGLFQTLPKALWTQVLTKFGVRVKSESYFHLRHAIYLAHETSILLLEMLADISSTPTYLFPEKHIDR